MLSGCGDAVGKIALAERARLAAHSLRPFPVWLVGVLNLITFGLFPFIHFGLMHDKLPKAASNDPSAGKAIGFQFIPYYNLYWIFFQSLRLCDRLTLQLKLRGRQDRAPTRPGARGVHRLGDSLCEYSDRLSHPVDDRGVHAAIDGQPDRSAESDGVGRVGRPGVCLLAAQRVFELLHTLPRIAERAVIGEYQYLPPCSSGEGRA